MTHPRFSLFFLLLLPLSSLGQFLPLPLDAESAFWNYAFTSQNSIGEEHVYFHGPSSNTTLDGKSYSPIYFVNYIINLQGNGTIDTLRSSGLLGYFRAEQSGKIFKKETQNESLFFDVNALSVGDTIPASWSILFSNLSYHLLLTNIDTLWDSNNLPHRKFIFHTPQNPYLTELYFIDGLGSSASFLSLIPLNLESPMYDLGCALIDSVPIYPSAQANCPDLPPPPFTSLPETGSSALPFPNPCSGWLHLPKQLLNHPESPVQIYSLQGSSAMQTTVSSSVLNLTGLENGLYFLFFPQVNLRFKLLLEKQP